MSDRFAPSVPYSPARDPHSNANHLPSLRSTAPSAASRARTLRTCCAVSRRSAAISSAFAPPTAHRQIKNPLFPTARHLVQSRSPPPVLPPPLPSRPRSSHTLAFVPPPTDRRLTHPSCCSLVMARFVAPCDNPASIAISAIAAVNTTPPLRIAHCAIDSAHTRADAPPWPVQDPVSSVSIHAHTSATASSRLVIRLSRIARTVAPVSPSAIPARKTSIRTTLGGADTWGNSHDVCRDGVSQLMCRIFSRWVVRSLTTTSMVALMSSLLSISASRPQ